MDIQYNTVIINGEPFNCYSSMSLYDLLIYLNFDIQRIVVEHNYKIIPSCEFNYVCVNHNDRLEVITIVGGG